MLNRPKIICHMLMSIDGKVTGNFLNSNEALAGCELYYKINRDSFSSFLCGRKTMEESFTKGYYPNLKEYDDIDVPEGDYICFEKGTLFAIAIDRYGKLGWKENKIVDEDPGYNGKTIIEVVTKKAPKSYLAYLRSINLSYIICGNEEFDLKIALKKLYHSFRINKIMLEGGSIINGVFNNLDFVDELNLVMVPVIADKNAKPLFDSSKIQNFQLEKIETHKDIVYLKYYNNNESPYFTNICNNDLNIALDNTNKILSNAKNMKISFNNAFEILKPNNLLTKYEKPQNSSLYFSYIDCEKELINPVFLKYLPVILNVDEKILKSILSRKLIAVFDKENNYVNFVKSNYIEKFNDKKYYIFTIIEFIKNHLKTLNIKSPKNENQKELFKILLDNNMSLNDIFIDKIIIPPHINYLLENKLEDNYLITSLFLKVLLRQERLTKLKNDNAPSLIVEFETTLLQDALNNYYQTIYEYMN